MKKSFVNRTILFFIAICLIPFLVYTLVFVNKTADIEQERANSSLLMIAQEKASALQKDLKNIENQTANLAQWSSYVMSQPADPSSLPAEYRRDERMILGRELYHTSGKSNVFLPSNVEITPGIAAEIINSEYMEEPMKNIRQQTPDVTYTYMVTANGLLRVFPYLGNEAFAPEHDQTSDYFYTRAVGENNPEGKAVWTKPYYDYGGNGWIITCSCPYYVDGELGGVVCIDVSLKTLAESIADFRIGNSGFAFVITNDGDVIYHPDMMGLISKRGDQLNTNLIEGRDVPPGYREIVTSMMAGEEGVAPYQNKEDGDHIIAYSSVKTLNWSLGVEVSQAEYSVGSDYITQSFWTLIAALLLACLIFAFFLSRKITLPIKRLTSDVSKITAGEFHQVQVDSEDEIGMLGNAFNKMSREISEYTASLIYGKKQLETVLNSIGGVMMLLKPDFSISMINEMGIKYLGIEDAQQARDQKCHMTFFGLDEPCKNCPVRNTLESGAACRCELVRDQNIYEITSYPVFENDRLKEIVVHSRRITEQVMLERELFHSEKMAGVGQMVAGITHELKNPLAVIKGAAYLLKANRNNKSKFEEALEEINSSVARAEKLIYNVLDFSKPSWTEKELINVKSLIEQILLLVRQDLVKRRINVSVALAQEPLYIYGNGDSVKHIFLNIVTNAVDAMPQGGELSIRADKNREDRTEIVFSNTGEPIPDENLDRIFDPFFTTKENGTGLGLWIVAKEVARNGGTIKASNQGLTQFKLILPGKEESDEDNTDD